MWNSSLVEGPRRVASLGPPDPETGERPFLGWLDGYRLNVARSVLPSGAEPYLMDPQPQTPRCIFAGDALVGDGTWSLTAFLVFPDEATAVAAMPDLWIEPPVGEA